MDNTRRDAWFVYNPPNGTQPVRYERIRSMGGQFVELIELLCPDSAERDLAVVNVRQAIMWANAAVACNE